MITTEELCADNRKLVDENLKLRKKLKDEAIRYADGLGLDKDNGFGRVNTQAHWQATMGYMEGYKAALKDKNDRNGESEVELKDAFHCMAEISLRKDELEKENAYLKERITNLENAGKDAGKVLCNYIKRAVDESLKGIVGEAKDIIKNLLRVTYGEGWNYSLEWKVKAEKFLEEIK